MCVCKKGVQLVLSWEAGIKASPQKLHLVLVLGSLSKTRFYSKLCAHASPLKVLRGACAMLEIEPRSAEFKTSVGFPVWSPYPLKLHSNPHLYFTNGADLG